MALSQPDTPAYSSQAKLHSDCENLVPSDLKTENVDAPWSTAMDSTHENLWTRLSVSNKEVEEWPSYSHTDSNSRSTARVLDLGNCSTTATPIQTAEDITSRGQSAQSATQLTTSDRQSIERDHESHRSTKFVTGTTRSPTVGSENRSPTVRSMEHLIGLPSFSPCDGASYPATPKSFIGDTSGALSSKQAIGTYYGSPSPVKHPIDASLQCGTLWSQQHLWSKSAPQHLHGNDLSTTYESNSLNAVSSCSVPDSSCLYLGLRGQSGVPDTPNPDSIGQSSNVPISQSANYPTPLVPQPPPTISSAAMVDEERGLHQPDGADHPDEHMWLYEDPQGRTQGTFSDAQMHDWLSEGIYFTENLRVRRRCDDSFSTLAQYCQLFGRIPFHPGPRVSPILGGITPSMVASSGHAERSSGLPSTHTNQLRSVSHGPMTHGFSSPIEGHTASMSGLSLGSSNVSSTSLTTNQRSPYKARAPLMPHDILSLGSSSMSPGFLSALAQCLSSNANPATNTLTSMGASSSTTLATGTPVSPMQHLAETAQLAAQLAAMAGAHSLDQTPMQPSQALALAEMLISSHLSPTSWPSQTKREALTPDTGAAGQATEFRTGHSGSRLHISGDAPLHTQARGLQSPGGLRDNLLTAWSISDALEASDSRGPCDRDGVLTKTNRETTSITSNKQRLSDTARNNRTGQSQKFQQNKGSDPNSGAANLSNSTGVISPGNNSKLEGLLSFAASIQRSPNPSYLTSTWKHTVGNVGGTTDYASNDSNLLNAEHLVSTKVSPAPKGHASFDGDIKIQTSNKATGKAYRKTTADGPNHTGSSNVPVKSGANKPTSSCVGNLQSPLKSQVNLSDLSESDPGVHSVVDLSAAAVVELELLTQWSIARLSSLPMKEKVDIPTVVELLATLDAPYEIERMVSTFLGESSRATQFVKDFLDHRRPFWKLHRQLREASIVVVGQSAASPTASSNAAVAGTSATASTERTTAVNAASSTVPTAGKKKKRTPTGGNTGGFVTVGVANSNHVLKGQSTACGDSSTDNQWHHIKPKSNHHRKANKGLDRKISS